MVHKEKPICYVCKNPIKSNLVYISNGTYRHKSCAPLTKKWERTKVGKKTLKLFGFSKRRDAVK